MRPRKKIGLALGGGGARGWAHISVINAIRDFGTEIRCVADAIRAGYAAAREAFAGGVFKAGSTMH